MVQDPLVRFPMTRRALAKQQTRRRLIDAARRLVAERGYEAATLRDVAALADVSTGAVFANFDDKADLFNEVIIDDRAALLAQMKRAAAQASSASQALLAMLAVASAVQIDQLSLLRAKMGFSWASTHDLEQRRRPCQRLILEALSDAVRGGVETGELAATVDAELIAEMAWDSYIAGCRHAAFDGWTLEKLTAHLEARVEVLLNGARICGWEAGQSHWTTSPRAESAPPRALRG
jgi:AcrR family transcriptional regulator